MPLNDLETEVKRCWMETVEAINKGIVFIKRGQRYSNNLPGSTDNKTMHVRPHASKRAYRFEDGTIIGNIYRDANILPDGRYMTKQCFWLNNKYIKSIIGEIE